MTKHRILSSTPRTWALCTLGALLAACASVGNPPPREGAPPEAKQGEERRGATYEDVLREMSERLSSAGSFTVRATRHLDAALIEGSDVPEIAQIRVSVKRPDRVRATSRSEDSVRHLYFDGRAVTLWNETLKMYATRPIEGNIDDLIVTLEERFGFVPPMAEFLASDPMGMIRDQVEAGRLGPVGSIEGRECQQIELRGELAEAELWVRVDDRLPCRLSVTFVDLEDRPGMVLEFQEWDLDAELDDALFRFEAPEDAREIELVPVSEIEEQPPAGRAATE